MKQFNFEITISADSEIEAYVKMKALSILASKLSAKELEKMAHIVKTDPIKTAIAKKALGV